MRLPLASPPQQAPPRRRWGPLLVAGCLILAITPFAVDLFSIARVNWDLMRGVPYPRASTPMFDRASDLVRSTWRGAWGGIGHRFHDAAWQPAQTIAFAMAWAFAAALLLRGGARR